MKRILLLIIVLLSSFVVQAQKDNSNTLTPKEVNEGWALLWDGKTTNGWVGAHKKTFPDKGWKVKEGILQVMDY